MANPLQPPYLTHAGNLALYLNNAPVVQSLQALTGSVSLTSPDSSITITSSGQAIQLQATAPSSGVSSVNLVTGAVTIDAGTGITVSQVTPQTITIDNAGVTALNNLNSGVTLTSPDASITITPVGQDIQLQAVFPPVQPAVNALNTLSGDVTLGSDDGSVTIGLLPGNIVDLAVNFPPANPVVESLNNVTGAVVLLDGGNITITPNEGNHTVTLTVPPFVASLNGLTDILSLTSPDASITITPNVGSGSIELVAPPQPFDTEGLQNKVGIFPVIPVTTTTLIASAQTPPTSYVPDGTVPTSSTTPEGTPCWLYTKPPALTGFNYYPYNPRFSIPLAPLPYRKANVGTRLKTLWALIQPVVNIYVAGTIALNVYTYDDANPPTSGFFNTRWAYSNTAGINSGQTGVNLFANYKYLVYAYDAPRTTNILGVGQPDNQNWGMRDPYDIYTDVHHIPLQNVVVAFNPWTDGTNYRTWNSSTAYVIGDTVVYSGSTVNPNGLFYTCVANNNNQAPVSATGVPNTTHWSAISPQPSSYASQPVLAININGISGTTGTWVAGNMMRVLSMGYSLGSSPTSTTESYEYVLN